MGATYTRQSSTEIVDGEVINAADFNNEFAQLVSAFAVSTGHTHDGTTAEGGPVTKLLGTAITIGDGTAGTDIAVTFDGETSDGLLTWMEDEDHFKFSDDVVIDSSKKLYVFDEGGEYLSGDGTDITVTSGADINLTATSDVNIPANVGVTFGNDAEKIEGDGTDLTISIISILLPPLMLIFLVGWVSHLQQRKRLSQMAQTSQLQSEVEETSISQRISVLLSVMTGKKLRAMVLILLLAAITLILLPLLMLLFLPM